MRIAPLALLAACALSAAGCAGDGGGGSSSSSSGACAAILHWRGTEYAGTGVRVPVPLGRSLGTGTMPGCDDVPGNPPEPDLSIPVVAVRGIDPAVAVGQADEPLTIYVAPGGGSPPGSLDRIVNGPPCEAPSPFVLEGSWVGASNLDEPLSVQIQVDDARGAGRRYLGLPVDLRVTPRTRGLHRRGDFVRLRPNERLRTVVRCVRARANNATFLAERVVLAHESPPPSPVAGACRPDAQGPPCGPGAALGVSYPYLLRTHCGIRDARFDGRWWVVTPPLDDGSDNPPPGWNNPFQHGLMRLLSPRLADFRVENRLDVVFHPAPADYRPEACE